MPSVSDNYFREGPRSNRSGEVVISGRHLTTTSGTLSTAAGAQDAPQYTLTKVGGQAGRYTVQFVNSRGDAVTWLKLTGFKAWVETAGAMTSTKGGAGAIYVRGGSATISTTGAIIVQLSQVSGADAEIDDGATLGLEFRVKRSSANP
jgi:hypothetical protein